MLDTAKATSKLSRRRVAQDQEIAAFSAAAGHYLATIFGNVEIANLLSGQGYGTAKLTRGCHLQQRLQAAIAHRQILLGQQNLAGGQQNIVGGETAKATADRNAAYEDLKTYMTQLQNVAAAALRHRPDLLKKLEG